MFHVFNVFSCWIWEEARTQLVGEVGESPSGFLDVGLLVLFCFVSFPCCFTHSSWCDVHGELSLPWRILYCWQSLLDTWIPQLFRIYHRATFFKDLLACDLLLVLNVSDAASSLFTFFSLSNFYQIAPFFGVCDGCWVGDFLAFFRMDCVIYCVEDWTLSEFYWQEMHVCVDVENNLINDEHKWTIQLLLMVANPLPDHLRDNFSFMCLLFYGHLLMSGSPLHNFLSTCVLRSLWKWSGSLVCIVVGCFKIGNVSYHAISNT